MDLGSEHERFIAERVFKKPVFVYNYPKDIKAFYMKVTEGTINIILKMESVLELWTCSFLKLVNLLEDPKEKKTSMFWSKESRTVACM